MECPEIEMREVSHMCNGTYHWPLGRLGASMTRRFKVHYRCRNKMRVVDNGRVDTSVAMHDIAHSCGCVILTVMSVV